jgi:hypothetical protein
LNLLTHDANWRYIQDQDLTTETTWFTPGYDDSTWPNGPGLLAYENNVEIVPLIGTMLEAPGVAAPGLPAPRVYFFRAEFNLSNDLAGFALTAGVRVDDGAVIYLNGQELTRLRMPTNATYTTLAALSPAGDATSWEPVMIPADRLLPGRNVIAAQVHQNSATSSDIVWGMMLQATRTITNISGGGLVINELLASNTSLRETNNSTPDWIELFNGSGNSIDLSGFSLTDSAAVRQRWIFPQGVVLSSMGYLQVLCDDGLPGSTTANGPLNTGFSLPASGGTVYLFDATPGTPAVSSVSYGIQAADFPISRIPDGSTSWTLGVPTPGAPNLPATLGNPVNLKVNEWMPRPASGEDWFEIYNQGAQPVALGGFFLSDDLTAPQMVTLRLVLIM